MLMCSINYTECVCCMCSINYTECVCCVCSMSVYVVCVV